MILLIDLDGTLTNTAFPEFKQMKDGEIDTDLSKIPLINGAIDFINTQKQKGNIPIIISDSHPKYVKPIAEQIFKTDYLSLTDKPNISKVLDLINRKNLNELFQNRDNFIVIGDSWLDIEFGRRLNIKTVLTKFYKSVQIEERDGIGQDWKPVKTGPTYLANTFQDLEEIIANPLKNLLAIEAVFQGENSWKMMKFNYFRTPEHFTLYRCLARQEDGECDRFSRGDKYYQIDNPQRTSDFLNKLALGVTNYLNRVSEFPQYRWDYLTYVTDKLTTQPPNKMKEIFELVNSKFTKIQIFDWSKEVVGSLRNMINYHARREFIAKYLFIKPDISLENKNVIVIDDQLTSSATANEIITQLRKKGVRNILFIALFYLIIPIESKNCPRCGKPLKIKIHHLQGNKFYSCVPPKYRGEGCGYTENIENGN